MRPDSICKRCAFSLTNVQEFLKSLPNKEGKISSKEINNILKQSPTHHKCCLPTRNSFSNNSSTGRVGLSSTGTSCKFFTKNN